MVSVKKNFIYSSIGTVSRFLFPLITYPYVSRVLGVHNIGICNFIDGIINYYTLFASMGIVFFAVREIAGVRDEQSKLNSKFSSIIVLHALASLIMLIVLLISIFSVPKLYQYKEMMFIGAFKLIFPIFTFEWLYGGVENFGYITKRSIIVNLLYVVMVFLFVRSKEDYVIYFTLSIITMAITALINSVYSRKFVRFTFRNISIRPLLAPFFILGIYRLLTSMYTSFNVAYLGFSCDETEVGYYTTATKLYMIMISIYGALTTVMVPRMSSLAALDNKEGFKDLCDKSVQFLFYFSMPLIVYSMVYAPQIVYIMSGQGYEPAVIPMRIIMFLLLINGYEQFQVVQVLMPLKKDKAVFINSVFGAIVGVVMNVLLVHSFKSIGTAIVLLSSEFTVLLSAQYFLNKYIHYHFPFHLLGKIILYALPISIILYGISRSNFHPFVILLVGGILLVFYYYLLYVRILKIQMVTENVKKISDRFLKRK